MTEATNIAASSSTTKAPAQNGAVLVETTTDDSASASKPKAKAGRKSRFSPAEDLIIVQKVAAAKAHIALHGDTIARYKQAALKANANPDFTNPITANSIQDCFGRLVEDFETRDAQNKVMSGVGGEIGELDELLNDMTEEKRDLVSKKKGKKDEKNEQEQRKLAAGRALVLQSLKNKVKKGRETSSDSDSEEVKAVTPKKRKLQKEDHSDGMSAFGEATKESDFARCAVDRERLGLEARKFGQDVLDRDPDRVQRAQERAERVEDANAQRVLMNQMREDSSKQLDAVLALVGTILETHK